MSNPLSKERKGELALIVLKEKLLREGVRLSKNVLRDFKNESKRLGVEKEELTIFMKEVFQELIDSIFSPNNKK